MAESSNSEVLSNSNLNNNSSQIDKGSNSYIQDAEKVNGRWAMLGFLALVGAYITTGQVIPGVFWTLKLLNSLCAI